MVGRKRWRYSSKYCKKVILEGTDGSFCRIASMEMWRDELESAFVGGNGTLEGRACFIVHHMDCGCSSDSIEACLHVVVGSDLMTVIFAKP